MKKIGFIGVGSMGAALTTVACKQLDPKEVMIFDTAVDKAQAMAESTGCSVAASVAELVSSVEFVSVCIKPQIVSAVLQSVMPVFKENYEKGIRQVVFSIAGAWTLEELDKLFQGAGLNMPVIRAMPNIPVRVGQGVILFSNNAYATDEDVKESMEIFSQGGLCEHVAEDLMPVACPVFSCSPAMVYMFIDALADGSVQIGMERDQARRFAAQAVLGSAAMVLEGSKSISDLRDELSTPGGMTIGATNLMEQMGFRGATQAGIVCAYKRQYEMDK